MVGALSQSVVERWLGASVAQPGRCFSTPESIRLVSGKARLSCPAGSRVQTPPEAPKNHVNRGCCHFGFFGDDHSCVASRVRLDPPPGEVICCLAGFLGESHDSGRVPGLDRIMDDGISSGGSRTFGGKSRDPLSFSRSGLIMGEFGDRRENSLRRGTASSSKVRVRLDLLGFYRYVLA